jgi:hypothetical protein
VVQVRALQARQAHLQLRHIRLLLALATALSSTANVVAQAGPVLNAVHLAPVSIPMHGTPSACRHGVHVQQLAP